MGMKKALFLFVCIGLHHCYGQLSVNILMPPAGIMDKQQLWNIIATNTETEPLAVQVQIRFSEVNTGQPVFTGSSSLFILSPGTTQLTPSTMGTVLYNIVNPDYQMDPGPTGLLPVGTFTVCYDFLISKYAKVVQECQQINIPPLGPLLLMQPSNGTTLQDLYPVFGWLPPSPVNSFNNLRYDLRVVEILANQTGADAIKDNVPLFNTSSLAATNFPYTHNAHALEPGKKYAWQILAMNNLTVIAKSETWTFLIKEDAVQGSLPKPDPVFFKLRKEGAHDGYAVCWGNLRFDYLNETSDTAWHVLLEDLTAPKHISFVIALDSTKLKRGQNLVNYDAAADKRFIDKHQYVIKVVNSRNEVWQLRFEYRKQD